MNSEHSQRQTVYSYEKQRRSFKRMFAASDGMPTVCIHKHWLYDCTAMALFEILIT